MQWLLCLIGSTRVLVPTSSVRLITEYEVGPPPPLASPYLSGIGILEKQLFLSIRVGFRQSAIRRRTAGLLLVPVRNSTDCAFEIDRVVGLSTEAPAELLPSEPPWLQRARSGERYLDVAAMRRSLGAA